jgi:hypothetical protein
MKTPYIALVIACLQFAGCDLINQKLGLEDPAKKEARQESEGKAVGSACRQSGRAIEDCYSIYSWLPKSPIYAGWREMDAYMRENQLETIAPQLPPPEPPSNGKKKKKASVESEEAAAESDKAAAEKSDAGHEKAASKH